MTMLCMTNWVPQQSRHVGQWPISFSGSAVTRLLSVSFQVARTGIAYPSGQSGASTGSLALLSRGASLHNADIISERPPYR